MKTKPTALIGREEELKKLAACIRAGRSVLLEGPVGVGKTHLALALTRSLGRKTFRIDGDSRYTEQKLSGWFDPPTVMKKGYGKESFIPGPLAEAMQSGGILFINELNRLPEGVQNVLLPAIDEKMLLVPRLGEIRAKEGFLVIATQNPKEFVATSHLSEAILDRFELIAMDYQSEAEETTIVVERLRAGLGVKKHAETIAEAAVRVARLTRSHPRVRRGASIRAALAVAELTAIFVADKVAIRDAFLQAVQMALPTRIEMERESDSDRSEQAELADLLRELGESALEAAPADLQKKN